MHDLDRALMEFEDDGESYKESAYHDDTEAGSPFDESEEMELASELLDVSDEAELDQFLGKVIKKASRKARKFMKSGTGRMIGKVLKKAAKVALPLAGRAVGTYFGGPVGGMVGSKVGSMAGNVFGLELEALNPADRELEVARRFVRFAGSAVRNAASPAPMMPSAKAAKRALITAARFHAPGMLRGLNREIVTTGGMPSGRWRQRGGTIVLKGV